jgi:hypothetical protein
MANSLNPLSVSQPVIRDPDGQVLVRIGLVLTLYFDDGFSASVRSRIGACLELFLSLCGPQLRWYLPPDAETWSQISPDALARVREWFESGTADYSWATSWRSGRTPLEAGEFQFNVLALEGKLPRLSFLQVILPINWLQTSLGPFPQVAWQFAQILRPFHGYGGLGFAAPSDIALRDAAQPEVYAMARRFPGIEVDRPVGHLFYLAEGIKGVNWLTILGEHWIATMGGVERLRALLDVRFVFHSYGGGLIIQAGDAPETGDVNQRLWPRAYAILARVLRPIRIRRHGSFDNAGEHRFTDETTMDWLSRFDTEPP